MLPSPANQLADWLRSPDDRLTRLEICYIRRRSFRWLVLLELAVGLTVLVVCCMFLLVGALLLLLLSGGDLDLDLDLPSLSPRFFAYSQEIAIQGMDQEGASLFEVVHQPTSLAERDALVAQVLAAASQATLVVHERIEGPLPEALESWYGGQPLLAHPEQRDLEVSLSVLRQWDWEVEVHDTGVRLERFAKPVSRFWGAVELTTNLLLPLMLFGLDGWGHSFRRAWADLRGVPPASWQVSITADAVNAFWQRGPRVEHRVVMHASDLLGLAFSPTLGFDRDVSRNKAALTLVADNELVRSAIPLAPREGRALRDVLVGTAVMTWTGLPTTMIRPSRCPYCGGLYVFSADSPCPSCGGWPSAT
jgi:hypothetical protein